MNRRCSVLLVSCLCLTASYTLAGETKPSKSALESDPAGWIDLLKGADLKSFNRVSIPPKSKLNAKNPWSVADDKKTLICDGAGIHEMLLWEREVGDGIFHVEWRFKKLEGKKGYNSGVYVRNSADGAIWHQAQVGSLNVGHLFGKTTIDGKPGSVPSNKLKGEQRGKEAGEWNIYEITCKGKTITLWINGAVTAVWDGCQVEKGYLGVEAEGWYIEFRNLKFKELK